MEEIMPIVAALFGIWFIVWLISSATKFLWNQGIIQKAFSLVTTSLLAGIGLFVLTGDPQYGIGGGLIGAFLAVGMNYEDFNA